MEERDEGFLFHILFTFLPFLLPPFPPLLNLPRGIDNINAVKPRRRTAMRYGAGLHGLPLAVEERAAEAVVTLVAYLHAGVPEFLGVRLVGHVFQHTGDFAVFDFVIQLAAELEIITLLIDRERAVANDVNALFNIFDHIIHG